MTETTLPQYAVQPTIVEFLGKVWDEREQEARVDRETPGSVWSEVDYQLARIAADRQILADYLDASECYATERTSFRDGQRFGLLMALARLAEANADHPDFREEWRP